MKIFIAAIIIGLLTSCGSSRTADGSFVNLNDAVKFIVSSLESNDDKAIANACLKINDQSSFDGAIHVLKWINEKESIRDLYKEQSFPNDETKFVLGGHNKELGHVHICFLNTNDVWRLETIFECK